MNKKIKRVEELGVNGCTEAMHNRAMELKAELIKRLTELEKIKKKSLLGRILCLFGLHSYSEEYAGLLNRKCKRCSKITQGKQDTYDLKGIKIKKG